MKTEVKKIPEKVCARVLQRSDAFRAFAARKARWNFGNIL